jgi:hypothetical protein
MPRREARKSLANSEAVCIAVDGYSPTGDCGSGNHDPILELTHLTRALGHHLLNLDRLD